MEKLSLNNKIVSMRGEVERAKVHSAHKLTREVKSLKIQKSWHTEIQREKKRMKAERLIMELLLMKKLNKDDVSKLALINTKTTLDALRADPKVPADQKVMARLASYPQLIKTVEKFQSQFPTWASIFPSLIENLGVEVKKVKKKGVPVELVKKVIKKGIEHQSVDKEILSGGSIHDSDLDTPSQVEKNSKTRLKAKKKNGQRLKSPPEVKSVGGKWKVEENEDDDTRDADVASIDMKRKNCSHTLNQSVDIEKAHAISIDIKKNEKSIIENQNADEETECDKHPIVKKKKSETSPKLLGKSIGKSINKVTAPRTKSMKVIRFSDLINKVRQEKSTETISIEEPLFTPATKAVDSFFVSEDGQSEFMSTVAVLEPLVTNDSQPNKYDKIREKYFNDFGRVPNRKELRLCERQQGCSNFKSFQYKPQSRPSKDSGYDRVPHNNARGFGINKNTEIEKPAYKWLGEKLSSEKLMPKATVPEGPVHPSWEAKKKQKEMLNISSFQGKIITFDD